jgi:predicted ATP-dependent Lon-type protease
MENLEAGVQLFSDDIKKLLKKIENNNDAEKVKLEIIGFLEGVRKAINDAKGVKKEVAKIISDLTNLLNDIIDLVNNLVSALEAKELLADIDVLINGHKLLSKGYVCSKKTNNDSTRSNR